MKVPHALSLNFTFLSVFHASNVGAKMCFNLLLLGSSNIVFICDAVMVLEATLKFSMVVLMLA